MTERRQLRERGKALLGVILWGCAVLAAVTSCVNRYCQSSPEDPAAEIVVSACRKPILHSVSPDGHYVFYSATDEHGKNIGWLLDTTTGEERRAVVGGEFWVDNNLLLARGTPSGGHSWEFWINDIRDNSRTPLQWILGLKETIIQQGNTIEFNPDGVMYRDSDKRLVFSADVVNWFRDADQVYYTDAGREIAIALAANFKEHPERNYALALPRCCYSAYPGDRTSILTFLESNRIPYTRLFVGERGGEGVLSHNGRFVAQGRTIRTADGEQVIARSPSHLSGRVAGWAYNDSGVYYRC